VAITHRISQFVETRAHIVRARRALTKTPRSERRRIVIGASGVVEPGWIPTEAAFLDLLEPDAWTRYIDEASLDAIVAEHVWEHLTVDEGARAAATCSRYLRHGGYVRVAVPDGLHPNSEYIASVRPGGTGLGADDHRVLYTYRTLSQQFEAAGFDVTLLEYFDEHGKFHAVDWDETLGMIHRSRRFDERNSDGSLVYTSIILDAVKPT
jgi:predicted SAM-dependent methyltransferase